MTDESIPAVLGNPPFSLCRRAGDFLFVSGHLGIKDGALVEGGIAPETEQTILNIQQVLRNNGADLDNVVKALVFLASVEEWPAMNAVYATHFGTPYPARSAIGAELALGARVEIEVVAHVPLGGGRMPSTPSIRKV